MLLSPQIIPTWDILSHEEWAQKVFVSRNYDNELVRRNCAKAVWGEEKLYKFSSSTMQDGASLRWEAIIFNLIIKDEDKSGKNEQQMKLCRKLLRAHQNRWGRARGHFPLNYIVTQIWTLNSKTNEKEANIKQYLQSSPLGTSSSYFSFLTF